MVLPPPPIDITALTSITLSGIVGIISAIQNSYCSKLDCCGCNCVRNSTLQTHPNKPLKKK